MRITCHSIDEFIISLDQGVDRNKGEGLYQNTIRVSVVRRPVDGTVRDAVKFDVVIQASTVVELPDESQYLLEFGQNCGRDYEDATQEKTGSDNAEEIRGRIVRYAQERGWRVLPGIIGE